MEIHLETDALAARRVFRTEVAGGDSRSACEILAEGTGLSKVRIKEAMQKGAVWLSRPAMPERRLRRASTVLRAGDGLALYYDARLLARVPPQAECRHDAGRFSLWYKPAGLLTQGTRYGDHCALLRQAEAALRPGRQAFLVHRLDREAQGLVVIAHDGAAAAALSGLFAARRVVKRYRVEVRGRIGEDGASGRIDRPLDGRAAQTRYTVLAYDPATDTSRLEVVMQTGRRHQIRRHLASAGFPVMGDPAHGRGNSDPAGLRLCAWGLEFTCPFTGRPRAFHMEPGEQPERSLSCSRSA
jgi:tRNA pseudouridine32 synthase/23S rRNA pseudouridine746 synthase